MKRQDKYQDTTTFHYYNANPKNRITTDCVIRALSTAMEKSYAEVVMELAKLQCESGYDDGDPKGYNRYLELNGWTKYNQPRKWDNTKYTGKEFCKELAIKNKNYIVNIGGHHIVAIINNKVNDIWDSTDGCIGNYWVKA